MKTFTTIVAAAALAASLAGPALAAEKASHAGHGAMHVTSDSALGDGVVKKIDKAGGKLTIAHGPLPNGMPAMTMAFRVKDPAWLGKLAEGQKIRFAVEDVAGVMTIVRLEAAK